MQQIEYYHKISKLETRCTKDYSEYIDLWKEIVSMNSFHIFSESVQNILDFLSKLFSNGHNYSQTNTVSSALSSIITIDEVPCQK